MPGGSPGTSAGDGVLDDGFGAIGLPGVVALTVRNKQNHSIMCNSTNTNYSNLPPMAADAVMPLTTGETGAK